MGRRHLYSNFHPSLRHFTHSFISLQFYEEKLYGSFWLAALRYFDHILGLFSSKQLNSTGKGEKRFSKKPGRYAIAAFFPPTDICRLAQVHKITE